MKMALLIVRAINEEDVQARLEGDPWYQEGILRLETIKPRHA
jgi:uncharacterized protein YciI